MKNIKEIVKRVAKRYDVEYDENSKSPKIRLKDGTIKELSLEDLEKVFVDEGEIDNLKWYSNKISLLINYGSSRLILKPTSIVTDATNNIQI